MSILMDAISINNKFMEIYAEPFIKSFNINDNGTNGNYYDSIYKFLFRL